MITYLFLQIFFQFYTCAVLTIVMLLYTNDHLSFPADFLPVFYLYS